MALIRNKPRDYELMRGNGIAVAPGARIFEGAALGLSNGLVRPLQSGDVFAGFALEAPAGPTARLAAMGRVALEVSGASAASLGASVYASDDDTFNLISGSVVGHVERVEGSRCLVAFAALAPGMSSQETDLVRGLIEQPWQARELRPSATTIALPSSVEGAMWFPLNETTGTDSVDRVQGLVATASGTTTNLRANAGQVTMDANTALVVRNSAVVDSIMQLDTLVGTLIVGVELEGGNPAATCHLWGYGDNGSATVGGYSGVLTTAGTITTWYGVVGGSTNVAPAFTLQALLASQGRRFHIWAFHRGLHQPSAATPTIWADGFAGDFHSRSTRYRSLEPGPVGAATVQGLRIGARPTGTTGGSANQVGGQITLPRLSNFFAVRLRGDQLGRVRRIVADIARTMPVGAVPRILNGGF